MSEIWTAKEEIKEDDGNLIIFQVIDEATGKEREERRYKEAIPLMFILSGYPEVIGIMMANADLPWRFRKSGEHIYIDGPSIGIDEYHPI